MSERNRVTRQHNNHQHSMNIPSGTIETLPKRQFRLPFRYLRTWIASILALICLPIGIALILVGSEMEDNLSDDWVEVTAQVVEYDDDSVTFELDSGDEAQYGFTVDEYVDTATFGEISVTGSICDLVNRVIVPNEVDAEFSVWVDDEDKPTEISCVPITQGLDGIYYTIGLALVILSILQLAGIIHSAGMRRK